MTAEIKKIPAHYWLSMFTPQLAIIAGVHNLDVTTDIGYDITEMILIKVGTKFN